MLTFAATNTIQTFINMRITKEQMVKDVFFLATAGKRSRDNFVDGMWLIETIAANNFAWAIRDWCNEVDKNPEEASKVFDKMVDMTYINTSGVNGMTERSRRVMDAYWQFK